MPFMLRLKAALPQEKGSVYGLKPNQRYSCTCSRVTISWASLPQLLRI